MALVVAASSGWTIGLVLGIVVALVAAAIVVTIFITASLLGGGLYRFGDRVFTGFAEIVRH